MKKNIFQIATLVIIISTVLTNNLSLAQETPDQPSGKLADKSVPAKE